MTLRMWILPLLLALAGCALIGCGDLSDYPHADDDASCSGAGSVGTLGCACAPLDTCKRSADGPLLACVDGLCQPAACTGDRPGEVGCACGGGQPCADGHVCDGGQCVVDTGQTLAIPADPSCYTPCRGDYTTPGGEVIRCSPEGLLPGCIDGAICRQGSCVIPRATPTEPDQQQHALTDQTSQGLSSCSLDSDCPDFQSCIQGACYSDCETSADCREGRVCFRHACRLPCSAASASCPANTACSTLDGEAGHCLPIASGDGPSAPSVDGSFTLSDVLLEFDATTTEGAFRIVNLGATYQEFTVRKARHREIKESGPLSVTEQPMPWLRMASGNDEPALVEELTVGVAGESEKEVRFAAADNPTLDRWHGTIEIRHATMGVKTLNLSFARSPEGQWVGSMYYFGNFSDGGLDEWLANRDDRTALRAVRNAFIRRWGALRNRNISLDEFEAAVTAMQTGSWQWDSVKQRCPRVGAADPNVGCYLYDNTEGIAVFSDFLPNNPIPTGVVDMPITLNLRASRGDPTRWEGKIVSSETLHYAGDPRIDLAFSGSPTSCSTSFGTTCVNLISSMSAEIFVGGRFASDASGVSCTGDFEHFRTPWLVPGFEEGTSLDPDVNRRFRSECRDSRLPFGKDFASLNASMASSNPIPDGATRRRRLELVDGALIDQGTLLIIFREVLPSFLDPRDPEEFSSYGYMILERGKGPALQAEDYEGFAPSDHREPPEVAGVSCSPDLLRTVFGRLDLPAATQLTSSNASKVALAVVRGVVPGDQPAPIIDENSAEKVHYLCVDTGYFNGGPGDDGSADASRLACPQGSRVEFFTSTRTHQQMAAESCQNGGGICRAGEPCEFDVSSLEGCRADGSCGEKGDWKPEYAAVSGGCTPGEACNNKGRCEDTLTTWKAQNKVRTNVVWHCEDPDRRSCDDDRLDLREGKIFYAEEASQAQDASGVVFRSLDDEIADAFRYKTRFRTRSGRSIGFAPEVCVGDAIPYCYDPAAIEAVEERIDCATHVYATYYDQLAPEARGALRTFLTWSFAYTEELVPGLATPLILDGFERLNSELLIMMGDESFTAAFASRFDLAGQQLADFQGSLFEPEGIDLSGGAGFEMYSLYQATQYYQLTLDRFYKQASVIWTSLGELPPGQGFITQATTTSYFDRLIRASAQKTRAWSEIAKRYQSFNRPDLARLVVERAYSQAYMESFLLGQMMRRVGERGITSGSAQAQIAKAIELGQLTYRMALLDMRNVYKDISDAQTFYGIPPDYIPFPALDPQDTNAFVKVMSRARELARTAAEKERRALEDSRSFDTDSALFQAELGRIRGDSEDRLSEICGTFPVALEGETQIYPAIPKYAYLTEETRAMGDPCGLVGNGELFDEIVGLDVARLDFDAIKQSHRNLLVTAADAEERAVAQCARIKSFADFVYTSDTQIMRWNDGIRSLELIIDTTSDLLDGLANIMDISNCEAFGCAASAVKSTAFGALTGINAVLTAANRAIIVGLEHEIEALERSKANVEIMQECAATQIDTIYEVRALLREAKILELEVAKLQNALRLSVSQIQRLRNEAISTMAGQAENEEMAINIEAARNDPNVRIYRNDAITAADRTFLATLKEAYRATKVFEYYTSQSYAAQDKLFLARMVSAGDFTLEAYLDDLEQAFVDFQEQYGNPDVRVAIVSLRDDIFRIPRTDDDGIAISEAQRSVLLRERLQDVNLIDPRGYLVMPFRTSVEGLSPLTRNHKVRFMEAEIVGDDIGDALGRVYVTQRGTGVVSSVRGGTNYYAFPVRTAVLNPFFNGSRALAGEIYRSERLRDRPLVNTGWDLVFNRKDEQVNKDIQLSSLTDIRLYLYYTDFTEL